MPSRMPGSASGGSARAEHQAGTRRHGVRLLARETAPARDDGDRRHQRQRHHARRHEPAEEQRADRGVGDQRIEDHGDRGGISGPSVAETTEVAAAKPRG